MQINYATLQTCKDAAGFVVVVDVLRAFTTSGFAFAAGAEKIILVSTVKEAFQLRERYSSYLLTGEMNGLPVAGFDLSNSPSALAGLKLSGRSSILRTTWGTQGVVRAVRAEKLLAASLCVASAMADCVRQYQPAAVTFVETGVQKNGGGEEDVACSHYMANLLLEHEIDRRGIEEQVMSSHTAKKFIDVKQPAFPREDLECALEIDRFGFTMEVKREDGLLSSEREHQNPYGTWKSKNTIT